MSDTVLCRGRACADSVPTRPQPMARRTGETAGRPRVGSAGCRASTSHRPTSPAARRSWSRMPSSRTGSPRSGRTSTPSSAELAALAGVEHAVALSSGTAALHLALVVLGIGAGDEVACSSLTFAASANAVTYAGATPFFVDCDEATWTLDPDAPRPGDRGAARGGSTRPRRARGRPLRPVLRLRRDPRGLRPARRPAPPGRGRVARGDLPGRARRRPGRRSRRSRSTATRSSRRAAAGCSSRRTAT